MSTIDALPTKLRAALVKKYGEELFAASYKPTGFISTGVPSLDAATGRGGIALGRFTTVVGQPSTGKSALLYSIFAETQRVGGYGILLETEGTYTDERFASIGGDPDQLLVLRPGAVEGVMAVMGQLIEWRQREFPEQPLVVAWDSVSATPLEREVDADGSVATMGGHSKLISQMMRQYTHKVGQAKTAVLMVTQWRSKISTMPSPFAENKVMIADAPLTFHSTLIVETQNLSKLKVDKTSDPHGIEIGFTVRKNKLASPYRKARAHYLFATGFDVPLSWLDLTVAGGVLKKQAGGYYLFPDGEKLRETDARSKVMADQALRDTAMGMALDASVVADEEEDEDQWSIK